MKNIYLTFVIDRTSDGVLKYFYDEICKLDICRMLNVTNHSLVLDENRKHG